MPNTEIDRVDIVTHPAWLELKSAASALQKLQAQDGSIAEAGSHAAATGHVDALRACIAELAPLFPHDAAYLDACTNDFRAWAEGGFGVPDFLSSILAFDPASLRINGVRHLVVFPMYTQNGSRNRFVEAVLVEVMWPDFIAELESSSYSNKLFLPIRFLDFTAGYDTNSAVLFPESVAMSQIPAFTWGAIFQLFDGIQAVSLGLLRGLQDVKIPTAITIFSYWVVGLPLSYYLGIYLPLGAVGVWIGLTASLICSAALLSWRFYARAKSINFEELVIED